MTKAACHEFLRKVVSLSSKPMTYSWRFFLPWAYFTCKKIFFKYAATGDIFVNTMKIKIAFDSSSYLSTLYHNIASHGGGFQLDKLNYVVQQSQFVPTAAEHQRPSVVQRMDTFLSFSLAPLRNQSTSLSLLLRNSPSCNPANFYIIKLVQPPLLRRLMTSEP